MFYWYVTNFFIQNMVGEWQPKENCEVTGPPRDNPILGHVVQRIFDMVNPPSVSTCLYTPEISWFLIVFCVIGQLSGWHANSYKSERKTQIIALGLIWQSCDSL